MYYYPVCTFRGRFNISNKGYELIFKINVLISALWPAS